MFIESKNDLKILMLIKVASCNFNCSINFTDFSLNWLKENDFWLDWDVTEVKNLFNIWVKVKLFCFNIILLLESRIINFK